MPTEQEIIEILSKIKDLPLKQALEYLAAQKILSFVGTKFSSIKKVLQDKHNEGKYGFVPDKNEAVLLLSYDRNPQYKEVLEIVPNYKYIDLIKTGILIRNYNDSINRNIDVDKNKKRIEHIKKNIMYRPNGKRLLKIVKFSTTYFFSVMLKYLHDLKHEGFPEDHLEEEFNELVDDWETSSMFVKNEHKLSEVASFCKKQMRNRKNPRFFVLALGNKSIKIANEAIGRLKTHKVFIKEGYSIKKIETGKEVPILEVIFLKNN